MSRFSIVLASASPRRKELLEQIGLRFEVVPACVDEHGVAAATPQELVTRLSRLKGEAVARLRPSDLVIASDTVVVSPDGEIFGKPSDESDARRMLRALSGAVHTVCSGVALLYNGQVRMGCSQTAVRFQPLTDGQIDAYIAADEWRDKAGAYAIQGKGSLFIEGIDGDYFTVVGLPLNLLGRLFAELGVSFSEIWGYDA